MNTKASNKIPPPLTPHEIAQALIVDEARRERALTAELAEAIMDDMVSFGRSLGILARVLRI